MYGTDYYTSYVPVYTQDQMIDLKLASLPKARYLRQFINKRTLLTLLNAATSSPRQIREAKYGLIVAYARRLPSHFCKCLQVAYTSP